MGVLAASGSASGNSNFLVPNGTFIAELIMFIIVLAVVARFILPPVQRAIRDRDERIRSALAESEDERGEAERLAEEKEERLRTARVEARTTLESAAREAAEIVEAARREAQARHDAELGEARQRIFAERAAVRAEVLEGFADLVVSAAERIVGSEIDRSKHNAALVPALLDQTGDPEA